MEWSKTVPEWTVFNMSRSLDFYTRVLGFRVVYKREGPLFAYLDLDGVQLMLEEFHENGWNTGQLEPPYGRGINIQMEVCDVSSVLSAISDNGIALYRNLTESWYPVEDVQETGQLEFLVRIRTVIFCVSPRSWKPEIEPDGPPPQSDLIRSAFRT